MAFSKMDLSFANGCHGFLALESKPSAKWNGEKPVVACTALLSAKVMAGRSSRHILGRPRARRQILACLATCSAVLLVC